MSTRSCRHTRGSRGSSSRPRRTGIFRTEVDALFAAQAFYGLIEQVLTQWIFSGLPIAAEEFERVKTEIVEMICGGLDG